MPNPLDYLKSLFQSNPSTGEGQDIELPSDTWQGPKWPSQPQNQPSNDWKGAATIGASKVGERYAEPTNPSVLDLVRQFTGGAARPRSVAAADPYGIEAWMKGAGPVPGMVMGSTEEVDGPVKKAFAGLKGMYSRVDRAADALPEALHPVKAEGIFKNNAAKEEIDYRGLGDFLKGSQEPKVTKAAIQDHLANNPMPEIGVKDLGGPSGVADERFSSGQLPSEAPTVYDRSNLNVPGGENYRERLLTLPEQLPSATPEEYQDWYYKKYASKPSIEHAQNALNAGTGNVTDFLREKAGVSPYKSGHWEEPNVLAHSRFDERYLPADPNDPMLQGYPADYAAKVGGEKGRFIQEVQSDWHQAGKEQGYQSDYMPFPTPEDHINAFNARDGIRQELLDKYKEDLGPVHPNMRNDQVIDALRMAGAAPEDIDRLEQAQTHLERVHNLIGGGKPEGVQDAPFKESWPDLVLKNHVLDVADRPDLNWLGFTTGDTQNARYDLAQHVRNMDYNPALGHLDLELLNGDRRAIQTTPEDLHTHVGRDMARRIMENPDTIIPDDPLPASVGATGNWHTVNLNQDEPLTVGGSGMRHFYDQKLPSALGKILKPFGGKVELGELPGPKPKMSIYSKQLPGDQWVGRLTANGEDVAHTWPPLPYGGRPEDVLQARQQSDALKQAVAQNPSFSKGIPAWIAHLPPEMKKAILEKGLPLLTLFGLGQLPPTTTPDPLKGLKDAR